MEPSERSLDERAPGEQSSDERSVDEPSEGGSLIAIWIAVGVVHAVIALFVGSILCLLGQKDLTLAFILAALLATWFASLLIPEAHPAIKGWLGLMFGTTTFLLEWLAHSLGVQLEELELQVLVAVIGSLFCPLILFGVFQGPGSLSEPER